MSVRGQPKVNTIAQALITVLGGIDKHKQPNNYFTSPIVGYGGFFATNSTPANDGTIDIEPVSWRIQDPGPTGAWGVVTYALGCSTMKNEKPIEAIQKLVSDIIFAIRTNPTLNGVVEDIWPLTWTANHEQFVTGGEANANVFVEVTYRFDYASP